MPEAEPKLSGVGEPMCPLIGDPTQADRSRLGIDVDTLKQYNLILTRFFSFNYNMLIPNIFIKQIDEQERGYKWQ